MAADGASFPPLGLATAVALLIGVLLVQLSPGLPPVSISAVVVAAAGIAFWRWPSSRLFSALVFGVALAAAHGRWAVDIRLDDALAGRVLQIEGEVLGLPLREHDSVRFEFRVRGGEAAARPLEGRKVRLGWYGPSPSIVPGESWRLKVSLKPPRGVLNPGGFDSEKRALEQRLAGTGHVRDVASARRLSTAGGIDAWRLRLSNRMAVALPGDRARFVQALALGDTRALSDSDWALLRVTGLTHLIAISGFHVGLVAGFGVLLMRGLYFVFGGWGRRWPRPQALALSGLVFAIGYTALAGFALPTLRTCLMIATIAVAHMFRRSASGAQCFALALIAVLLFDPLSVLAPGFWLSFAGVAWLLWCLPHDPDSGVVRPFLQAQAVAVLGLLPFTVWFFGQASLLGPFTNLIGIPWISLVVVPMALLGLLLSPLSETLAAWCWQTSAWLMDGLWRCLEWLGQSPWSLLWLPEPDALALSLALCAAFWLLLPRGVPGKPLALLLLLPLLWPNIERPSRGEVDIALIDVGQGLSVLVTTERHALLFDAGPASERGLDLGESAVVPALRGTGLKNLDVLLLSHGDNDHVGGSEAVRRAFPGVRVLAPEGWAGEGMDVCRRGARWKWDDVNFQILHPPPHYPYLRNDSSCVLRVEAGGTVALLPGDIGKHVEARLVHEQAQALRADLLVAAHHGSDTSSTAEFVAAVDPKLVLVATGAYSRFRLPKQDVVQRYRQRGADVAGSVESGWLRVRMSDRGLRDLQRRRVDQARYWRQPAPAEALSGYATGRNHDHE